MKGRMKKYSSIFLQNMPYDTDSRRSFLFVFSLCAYTDKEDECLSLSFAISFLSAFFLIYPLSERQLYKCGISFKLFSGRKEKSDFFELTMST